MIELVFDAIAQVAIAVSLVTGRAVLIVASLGRIRTGPFWGGRKARRFGLSRDATGHLLVGDLWAVLCGAAVWATFILIGWWLT
ncbi:hypothetical protein ACQR1Y_01405 [Bradyrhizobium sp. HKCCYLRH3099]|uniref:hypothetical protein n=1 Tax=unclassified Bradyrhizobium TaxID=2631580 RepID=UPI003EBFE755